MTVIKMPPRKDCPTCQAPAPLRPATHAEVEADQANPRTAHVAEAVAQGHMDAEAPPDWPGWMAPPAGSWLLVCDRCGLRMRCDTMEADPEDDAGGGDWP